MVNAAGIPTYETLTHIQRGAPTWSPPPSCSSAYICLTWQRLDGATPGRVAARERARQQRNSADLIYFLLLFNWIRDLSHIRIKASHLHTFGVFTVKIRCSYSRHITLQLKLHLLPPFGFFPSFCPSSRISSFLFASFFNLFLHSLSCSNITISSLEHTCCLSLTTCTQRHAGISFCSLNIKSCSALKSFSTFQRCLLLTRSSSDVPLEFPTTGPLCPVVASVIPH